MRQHDGTVLARAVGPQIQSGPNSDTRITVYWVDDARNESGWEVHRSTTGNAGPYMLLATLAANTTQHADAGLTPLTEYCYKVRSFRRSGAKNQYAAFTTFSCTNTLGPPAAASNVLATPRNSSAIDVSWRNNETGPFDQRLELSSSSTGPWQAYRSFDKWTTLFGDEGLPSETFRCYRLVAVNAYGETASSAVCTAAPSAPLDVAAAASGSSVVVSWTDASVVEDGYEVQRSLDGLQFSGIATVAADATGYVDGSVAVNTRYWYRVRARKDGGFSSASAAASAVVVTSPPASPADVAAYATGSSVSVWFTESFGAASFRVERSTDDGSSWAPAGSVANTPFSEERALESRVCYRVIAVNAIGESAPSAVDCATPLAAPTNIITTAGPDGLPVLTWTDNSGVETGYEIWVMDCSIYVECEWRYVVAPANSTSISLGYYEVLAYMYAFNDSGVSDAAYEGAAGAAGRSLSQPPRPGAGARSPLEASRRAAPVNRPRLPRR